MEQLVPGDIVNIEAGDLVPADGRIIRAATLEIDESALTGESLPVPKQVEPVAADAALGDRIDMAFMNTQVTRGAGTLVVDDDRHGHGSRPHLGDAPGDHGRRDAADAAAGGPDEPDPRHRGRRPAAPRSPSGSRAARPFQTLFLTAVAFAVSAIPTGLPAVVTAVLSAGTTTLAKAGAIVKRLRSVETLGSTSAINSDKTGTLTLNQMTAVQMTIGGRRYAISGDGYSTEGTITHVGGQAGRVARRVHAADGPLRRRGRRRTATLIGDPTEGALVVLAAKGGADPKLTREQYPRVAVLPFDAAYKLMATFHRMKDASGKDVIRAYVKGAPDQLLGARRERRTARAPPTCRSPSSRIGTSPRTRASRNRACASWRRRSATSTRPRSMPTATCSR